MKTVMLCLLWMSPLAVSAHTFVYGGYIVSVDTAATPGSVPGILLLPTWVNMDRDYGLFKVAIPDRYICFLDGKRLEPAVFLKTVRPGMAVRVLQDLYYIRAYSDPGFLPASPDAVLGSHGALTVRLQQIGEFVCPKVGGEPGRNDTRRPDAVLHFGLEGGRIVEGIAITPGVGAPWQAKDAGGLSLQAGRLTGTVKVTLRGLDRLIDGKPTRDCVFTLDASIAADGAVTGAYSGTVGEKKATGKTVGQAQLPRDLRGDLGVWVTMNYDTASEKGGSWCGRWTFSRKDGKVVGGPAVTTHGYVSGQVEKGMLQLDGNFFRAEISGYGQLKTDSRSFTLQGQIAGDILYGTFSDAEGKTGRCRGEIRRPDAPPVWGWSEPVLKRQIAKGEYPE